MVKVDREFIVRLRADPDVSAKDRLLNLRAILKKLLRSHGFKCVTCEPAKPKKEK